MILIVDEEVQGTKKEFSNIDDMKKALMELVDENVKTVTVKKRAVRDNSQNVETKGDF